jgi:hypothetical protein
MKIKKYGDFCEEMNETNNDFFSENSNSLELFKYNDISSSNTFNRPILNLQSEIEENHRALQEISKIFLQDKKTGYIKDALEGLSAENIKLITYNNKTYVRIPTGVLLINERSNANIYTSGEDDFGNRRLGENNDINIYVNAPNINLFERQIADHFNIDLNMPGNNVSVNYKIIIDKNDNNKRKIQYTYKITTKEVEMTESVPPNILEKTYTSEDANYGVFDNTSVLIEHLKSRLNNKYFKNDDNYSLEELIELTDNASNIYIFLRTKPRNQESFKYSSSGNFGVYIPNDNSQDEENIVSFVSKFGGILLFKKSAGGSNFKNVITEIDRNLLELRKLDVNNVLNANNILNLNNKVKINKKGEIVTLSNINKEGVENFEIDDSIDFGINGRLLVKDYGTTSADGGDNSKVQFEWRITKKDEINSLITS